MDINKIQKLNEMAINLRRHNIGFSKEDAIEQAERIYGSHNNFSRENPISVPDAGDEMKKELRKLTFAVQNTMAELRELKSHVGKLEQQLNDARLGQLTPRKSSIEIESNIPIAQEKLSVRESHNKVDKPIDRNQVAPSEVAIEKFFYFGNK